LCTCKARGGIETNTITTCAAVDFDFTSVRLEAGSRIFCGDTTLNREATFGDCVLCKTELGKCGTGGNLNLCSNNIETSDFL
jgi:hypothetical protein